MTNEVFDEKRLYNPEIKMHYLDDFDGKESTKKTIYNALVRASTFERSRKKDLYEMTDEELRDLLHGANISSEPSMRAYFSTINAYIRWCSLHYGGSKMARFGGVPFARIAHEFLSTLKSIYVTQDELNEVYKLFTSNSDKFIVQAIFEGISGKGYTELSNLKIEDFSEDGGEFYVDLSHSSGDTRRSEHRISKLLYDLAHEANEEILMVTATGIKRMYVHSPYIIKQFKYGKNKDGNEEPVEYKYISNRFQNIRTHFDMSDITLRNINDSGMMYYLYELIKDKEEEIVQITNDYLTEVAYRFNIGIYTHSVTLEDTVNYDYIKSRIPLDFFNSHYRKISF